jgi:hypothetical protein
MIVGIGEMRMSSFDPEFDKGGDRKFRRRKRQVSGVLMTLEGDETGGSKRGGEGRTRVSKGFPWSREWVTGHEATIRSERETGGDERAAGGSPDKAGGPRWPERGSAILGC